MPRTREIIDKKGKLMMRMQSRVVFVTNFPSIISVIMRRRRSVLEVGNELLQKLFGERPRLKPELLS